MENTRIRSAGEAGALVFRTASGDPVFTLSDGLQKVNLSSSATVTVAQSGMDILCTTDAMVYTLPSCTTSVAGLTFNFVNAANSYGALSFQIQAPTTDGFVGGTISTAVAGSRLTLVKATATPGDRVTIINTGSTTYCIQNMIGTWTNT